VRNSLLPVVTFVGLTLGSYVGGAIITETVFQYNGVGYLLSRAITTNNAPIITAVVIYTVVAYVLLSMVVDVLYAYLDPRIRLN
jgi:ABC-type dipeptide/oligopeptide/nickel transport system permease component